MLKFGGKWGFAMGTSKPLSTIAYNEDVLCRGLLKLQNRGVISFWSYIMHYGEGEATHENKDHYHVYIELYKNVDPFSLRSEFLDKDGNYTTLIWRKSNFADWYWYNLHNEEYLSSKGLKRVYAYSHENFNASENDVFAQLVADNPLPNSSRVRSAILSGMSDREMFLTGLINTQNVGGVTSIKSILNPKINDK